MEKRVLMTGFEPFGGELINPALEAVRRLNGKTLPGTNGYQIVTEEIPVVYGQSIRTLEHAIKQWNPEIVISIGQAGGRTNITPERIAININDAPIPDNAGANPIDQPIAANGPAAYFSTLPIKKMVETIRDAHIPASVSNSAGTYVCNHLFYGLMHFIATKQPHIRGGFIHIPYLPEQVVHRDVPSLSLADIVRGLEIAASVAVQTDVDIAVGGGAQF